MITFVSPSTARSPIDDGIQQEDFCSSNMILVNERTFIMIEPDGIERGLVGFKLIVRLFMRSSDDHIVKDTI